jgi:hypothetical protein
MDLLSLVIFSDVSDPNQIAATRVSYSAKIQNLFNITASVRRSKAGPQAYLVGVVVTNNSADAFAFEDIGLVSPFWKVDSPTK